LFSKLIARSVGNSRPKGRFDINFEKQGLG